MIPDWLYVSQLSGSSGTTTITVSAGTNSKIYEKIQLLNINVNNTDIDDVVVINQEAIDFLTFKIISTGTICWKTLSSESTKTIEYSKNEGAWTSITSSTEGIVINVSAGDIIKFRGNNSSYYQSLFSGSTAIFKVSGNIMSLIDDTNFGNETTVYENSFAQLFSYCTGLTDASELMLPATSLAQSCYSAMFRGCTSLTTAPELPATTLADNCYYYMFQGCSSLTTAPELPATTVVFRCYFYMFDGCSSLTSAPALPATTLASRCYDSMFGDCISLTTAPDLPATTLAIQCYADMFYGCTSLTTAPELPATTLTDGCYFEMFRYCSSLNNIKCLATDISATDCTKEWVNGVASAGTFVKATGANWPSGVNGIPTGWTIISE